MYLLSYLGPLVAIGIFITNIFVALGVLKDAQKLQSETGKELKLFTPNIWALICLFGSIPALALYWAMHHSTFAK